KNVAATTITDQIDQATSKTAVTFEAGPYTYRGTAFTATAAVTGVGGLNQSVTVVYSGDCTNVTTANGCTTTANFAGDMNQTGSTASTTINITQANQSMTWHAPATMTYGGPLSSTQLNATVVGVAGGSAPGSLTYNPAAGTVLSVGPQTLTVTAAATANYNLALKTVQINVLYASGGICDGDSRYQ